MIPTLLILKWAHIIAMVYWLGGEWGVFQTSYHVTNPRLPLEERRRHMETAYRIDILARLGRSTEALTAARRALEIAPGHTEAAQLIRTLSNSPK